jgi:hypothetical protein
MKVRKIREIDWNYDELYLLWKEIDILLDQVGHEDEALCQEQVRDRLRGLAISLGIHADFLHEYSKSCQENGLVLAVKQD